LLEHWNEKERRNIDSWVPGNMDVWLPEQIEEKKEQMPIILTEYPETNTAFNVTEMNRKVIQTAFKRGKIKIEYLNKI
jgi:poly(A) polymerase Pap1